MSQLHTYKSYIEYLVDQTKKQQLDDLANGILQTHFNFKVAELQAENTELRKHIEAAIDDLPHKPDSARDYLIHALKGK